MPLRNLSDLIIKNINMKNLKKILIASLITIFAIPLAALASPVSVDRLNNDHIEPLIKTDFIKANYFTATSTTATSTFPNVYIQNLLRIGYARNTDNIPFLIKNWTDSAGSNSYGSFSIGTSNTIGVAPQQFVVGNDNVVNTDVGGAFGSYNTVSSEDSWAFGHSNAMSGSRLLGIGVNNAISGVGANEMLIGHDNAANGDGNQYGVGRNLTLSAAGTSVFGQNITNSVSGSTQVGNGNTAKITIDSSGNTTATGYIEGEAGILNESIYQDSIGSTGSNGNVLTSTGSATLWVATSSLGISGGGASLSGGTTNWLTYWTSASTVGATSSPVVGYITATTTTPSVFTGGFSTTGNSSIGVADTTRPLTVSQANGIFSHFGSNIANTNGNCTGVTFGLITAGSYIKSGIAQVQRADGSNRGDVVILNNNTANSSNVGCTDIKATFKADGKIGFGTTTPSNAFEVNGSGYFSGNLTATNASTTATSATTLCLSTDCRTAWPTGGSGGGIATSTAIANTEVIYGTSATTVGSEPAFNYNSSTDKLTVANASTTNLTVATDSYLGTVKSGTWNGSTIGVPYGGTGATTFTNNRLLTGNGTSAIVDEANLTFDGTTLVVGGSGGATVGGSSAHYSGFAVQKANVVFEVNDTAGASNQKNWYFQASGGALYWGAVNDAFSSGTNYARIVRSGSSVTEWDLLWAAGSSSRTPLVVTPSLVTISSATEQLRTSYDGSNYYSTTVGSTGGVTFDAVGSGSAFTFSDKVNMGLASTTQLTVSTQATLASTTMTAPLRLKGYTVATLPTGTQGDTAFVTDALTPTFLTAVTGGGAIVSPVFYNGTNWVTY